MSDQVASAHGDTETVRSKLAACKRDIAQAETALRAISLQAALSEDPDAGHDAVARLNQLRGKRELLVNALAAAEQAAAEREQAARHREWQARKRSLAQKAGQLEREAAEVARLTSELQNARIRIAETGQGIVALLPPSLRTDARRYPAMFATRSLRELCDLERWRLDQEAPKPKLRLTEYWPNFIDVPTGRVTPITELVGQLCASLKREFDASGLSALKEEPQPAPAPQQTQGVSHGAAPEENVPPEQEEETAAVTCGQAASTDADRLAAEELAAAFRPSEPQEQEVDQ
jgi:hypothetical protein